MRSPPLARSRAQESRDCRRTGCGHRDGQSAYQYDLSETRGHQPRSSYHARASSRPPPVGTRFIASDSPWKSYPHICPLVEVLMGCVWVHSEVSDVFSAARAKNHQQKRKRNESHTETAISTAQLAGFE